MTVHRYDREILFGGLSIGNAAAGSIQHQTLGTLGVWGGYSVTNFTISRDMSQVSTVDQLRQVVNTLIYDLMKSRG